MEKAFRAGLGLTALAAVALFTGAQQATSQSSDVCAPRDDLVAQLDAQYREIQKAVGLLGEEAVMEIFASDQGTWTILTTDTSGTSCIVAAGEGWDENSATLASRGEGV
ncbi:hypothetical protein [Chelativorans sp. AA-79]|uniref:hypothetical protein n=1 Tax=Chelativorans sp. AA-79 TaxID=3028735 RepID=UPI0023FA3B71|nr:hypothetical protein [Chelativorans sp. AA-79]WEX09737.1 hypothetical protein PVE73_01825 [Chelativorans sp. AA-79]